jgi:hypothetical protein
MKALLLTATLFLICGTAYAQTQKRALHCDYEAGRELHCVYRAGAEGEEVRRVIFVVPDNHPWARVLNELQIGDSTVEIEKRDQSFCLTKAHRLNGFEKNPVNREFEICVPAKTLRIGRQF